MKIAIVTGGSRGLGRETVLSLAKERVCSIFTYHTRESDAHNIVAAVEAEGCKPLALQLDAGDTSSFDAFVDRVRSALLDLGATRFDYLVNNAGTSHHAPIEEVTEDDFDTLYNVHLKGVFFLTQKLLPLMNDGGRIVNVSSGLASLPSSARASVPRYCRRHLRRADLRNRPPETTPDMAASSVSTATATASTEKGLADLRTSYAITIKRRITAPMICLGRLPPSQSRRKCSKHRSVPHSRYGWHMSTRLT